MDTPSLRDRIEHDVLPNPGENETVNDMMRLAGYRAKLIALADLIEKRPENETDSDRATTLDAARIYISTWQ